MIEIWKEDKVDDLDTEAIIESVLNNKEEGFSEVVKKYTVSFIYISI